MKKLLIVADDFGMAPGVCQSIVEGIKQGHISLTSAMVCQEDNLEQLLAWKDLIPGAIGIHLQLTDGVPVLPCAKVSSLVNQAGRFPRHFRELGDLDPDQIEAEWCAQMARLKALGIEPTHMDCHHHVHRHPQVRAVYLKLAKRWGLLVRGFKESMTAEIRAAGGHCVDYAMLRMLDQFASPEALLDDLELRFSQLGGAATIELGCHPAKLDDVLCAKSLYTHEREKEAAFLASYAWLGGLERRGIQLLKGKDIQPLWCAEVQHG